MKHVVSSTLAMLAVLAVVGIGACGEEQLVDGGEPLIKSPNCDELRSCCTVISLNHPASAGGADGSGGSTSSCTADFTAAQHGNDVDAQCAALLPTYLGSCPGVTSTTGGGAGTTGASGSGGSSTSSNACVELISCCAQLSTPTLQMTCQSTAISLVAMPAVCQTLLDSYVAMQSCVVAAGAGGAGGAGGSSAMSCGPFAGDATCNSCLQASCCTQAATCGADSGCATLVENHCTNCTDAACAPSCQSQDSINAYNAFKNCVDGAGCTSCGI